MRALVLAAFFFGVAGTAVELLLVGHTENFWQWLPLLLIAISLGPLALFRVWRAALCLRIFQVVMFLFMASGLVGLFLHYDAKVEFKRESDPSLAGWPLFREAIKSAVPPALAPAAMIQFGLLGLAFTYRHQAFSPKPQNDMKDRSPISKTITILFFAITLAASAPGQLGRQQGLLDLNTAPEKELAALPHLNADLAKEIVAQRPFLNITNLNALLAKSLKPEQLAELYRKTFVHVNLNSATREELLLIPGLGKRMAHEFEEYRPYKSLAQFRKEIGKYVDEKEVARLEQYVFIPVNLNSATDEEILTIPGLGKRMLHEFKEYRPYKSMEQFRKEIGKYVNKTELARLERYVTLN